MAEHLVIVDGHHLMYRAYYALPPSMRTSKGEQTNAVFGVASMVLALLNVEEPSSLLFCFDAGEETFRHQEHDAYKEGRPETPEEFLLQIPRCLEIIDAFGFPRVSDLQYEADDFLCTYARAAEQTGTRVTIVTGDRDALQLADEQIRIAIPHKGYQQTEYLGPDEILRKFGVRPDQIPSYKGLVGDVSDNLPGVRGVGPKTAAQLLQEHGTLEGVYAHLGDIKPSVREKLERDQEQAFFCERMARLVCDIPLPVPLVALELKGIRVDRAVTLFQELEFTVLLRRLETLLSTPYGQAHFHRSDVPLGSPEGKRREGGKGQLVLFS